MQDQTQKTLRELLFQQANLYRGVTREQFDKDRPGLFPIDAGHKARQLENDAEIAAHNKAFGR